MQFTSFEQLLSLHRIFFDVDGDSEHWMRSTEV